MNDDDNWYFDNITEDIVYGDIKSDGPWIEMKRRIKKSLVIRKMANDRRISTTGALPRSLGKAIDNYRQSQ